MLRDCAEGAAWFGVSGLPTVILDEKVSLVGAVPAERYRLLIRSNRGQSTRFQQRRGLEPADLIEVEYEALPAVVDGASTVTPRQSVENSRCGYVWIRG